MKLLSYISLLLISTASFAQQPTHVPSPQNNSPIDLNNWFDIIVFIIIPVVLVVIYFLWRSQVRKDKEAERQNEGNS
tara:strand:- start:33330 stop:33560 length:231 start_codon:yes stop_codon:yes gene_type:complete